VQAASPEIHGGGSKTQQARHEMPRLFMNI